MALTLLAHGTALFTFFAVDDFVFLSQVGFPRWEGVADAFAQRPLAFALFHGHRLAFGTHPLPFHVTALLLHVVNAWLTYALGTYVLPRRSLALAAGAIFALHPAAHTPLAWTSAGFNEIPAVTFTLLATLVLARSIATRAPFVVSCLPVLSGVLALGFKQQAILAPLYLVVSGAIVGWQAPDQASRQVATRRLVWGVLPFTPLGIYFLLFILPRMQLVFGLPYQLGNDIAEVLSALARLVTHALNPVAVWRDALGFQGAVPSATERWPWSWLATLMVATVVCIGATVAWRRREGAHYLGLSLLLVGTLAWAAFLPLHLTDYYVYFSLPAAACLLAFPAVAARDVLSQLGTSMRATGRCRTGHCRVRGGAGLISRANLLVEQAQGARDIDEAIRRLPATIGHVHFVAPSQRASLDTLDGRSITSVHPSRGLQVTFGVSGVGDAATHEAIGTALLSFERVNGRWQVLRLDAAPIPSRGWTTVEAGRRLPIRTFTVQHDGLGTVQVPVRFFGRGDCTIGYRVFRLGVDAGPELAAGTRACALAAAQGQLSIDVETEEPSAGRTYGIEMWRDDADNAEATFQVAIGEGAEGLVADDRNGDRAAAQVVVRVILDQGRRPGRTKVRDR